MPDSNDRTFTTFVLQHDYNQKRAGEPDNWQWGDTGFQLRADTKEEAVERGRAYVARSGTSRFCRGHRIVERVTVQTDTVVEEIK